MTTAIIDYGSGNLHSAQKAFEQAARTQGLSTQILVTSDPETVRNSDRVVLPGVGAFADCRRGLDAVPGMGQFEPAIGASFTVPVGQVGGPFKAVDGMVVLRVDSRTEASRPAFEADKGAQRQQLVQSLRQQRVDEFLTNLRESVTVVDKRPTVMSALRRQSGV